MNKCLYRNVCAYVLMFALFPATLIKFNGVAFFDEVIIFNLVIITLACGVSVNRRIDPLWAGFLGYILIVGINGVFFNGGDEFQDYRFGFILLSLPFVSTLIRYSLTAESLKKSLRVAHLLSTILIIPLPMMSASLLKQPFFTYQDNLFLGFSLVGSSYLMLIFATLTWIISLSDNNRSFLYFFIFLFAVIIHDSRLGAFFLIFFIMPMALLRQTKLSIVWILIVLLFFATFSNKFHSLLWELSVFWQQLLSGQDLHSDSGRQRLVEQAIQIAIRDPSTLMFGEGLGSSKFLLAEFYPGVDVRRGVGISSMILDMGLVGILFVCGLLMKSAKKIWMYFDRNEGQNLSMSRFVAALFPVSIFLSMFITDLVDLMLFYVLLMPFFYKSLFEWGLTQPLKTVVNK